MSRTMITLLVALVAAGLWLFAYVKHEYWFVRVPWVSVILTASALAFVAVGVVGRGWRALLAAAVASLGATVLLQIIFLVDDEAPVQSACDPGCIPLEVSAVLTAAGAITLAAAGIAIRRLPASVRRHRQGDH